MLGFTGGRGYQPTSSGSSGAGVTNVTSPLNTIAIDPTTGDVEIDLPESGVVAGSYGSSSVVPFITVDAYGRITTAIAAPINVSNISAGTLLISHGGTGSNVALTGNKLMLSSVGATSIIESGITYNNLSGAMGLSSAISSPIITVTFTGANGASSGAGLQLTQDSGAAATNGARLGILQFAGATNASHAIRASSYIKSNATQDWITSEVGSQIEIATVPNGSITPITALMVNQDQTLTIPLGMFIGGSGTPFAFYDVFSFTATLSGWSGTATTTATGIIIGNYVWYLITITPTSTLIATITSVITGLPYVALFNSPGIQKATAQTITESTNYVLSAAVVMGATGAVTVGQTLLVSGSYPVST